MKELKDPLAVEVEHSQIIGLVQIAFDRVKVPAVTLPGERQGNLERDELADAFLPEHPKELLVVQGLVRGENEQRTARREQQKRFHWILLCAPPYLIFAGTPSGAPAPYEPAPPWRLAMRVCPCWTILRRPFCPDSASNPGWLAWWPFGPPTSS